MPSMRFLPDDKLVPNIEKALAARSVPRPTIDERDAVICWGWQRRDDGEVAGDWSDMRVFDTRIVTGSSGGEDGRIYAEAIGTAGSIEAGWLGNAGRTCQGVFSRALYDGEIPEGAAYIDVLLQFAKVRECDWARFMLAALYASTIMDEDESDLVDPAA